MECMLKQQGSYCCILIVFIFLQRVNKKLNSIDNRRKQENENRIGSGDYAFPKFSESNEYWGTDRKSSDTIQGESAKNSEQRYCEQSYKLWNF